MFEEMKSYPILDLQEILEDSKFELSKIRDSKIAILGGTGFIGSWIVETLDLANRELKSNLNISIHTRDIDAAKSRFRYLKSDQINFVQVDFSSTEESLSEFDIFINGATASTKKTGAGESKNVWDSTLNSSRAIVSSAKKHGNWPTVVNLSSGAIYKLHESKRFVNGHPMSEDLYAEAKVQSEQLLIEAQNNELIRVSSPRLFAFCGPGLPLDQHFAVGNFVNDAIQRRPIYVKGNPDTVRSYLYPTDLIIALLGLCAEPRLNPIDIGGSTPVTIKSLAEIISNSHGHVGIRYLSNDDPATTYLPKLDGLTTLLPRSTKVGLVEGIERWIKWLKS